MLNINLYICAPYSVPRFKQRFSIIVPPIGNITGTLDAVKTATAIVFVTSVINQTYNDGKQEIVDNWGKEVIVSCFAQGLPVTIVAVHNIQKLDIKVSSTVVTISLYKQHIKLNFSLFLNVLFTNLM